VDTPCPLAPLASLTGPEPELAGSSVRALPPLRIVHAGAGTLSHGSQVWFTMFAMVGVVSGLLAGVLLWLILTRPLLVAQTVAGLP
jgi:hypothetical protein